MKKNKGLIVFIAVLIILFIPIITDYIGKQKIEVISNKSLSEKMVGWQFALNPWKKEKIFS